MRLCGGKGCGVLLEGLALLNGKTFGSVHLRMKRVFHISARVLKTILFVVVIFVLIVAIFLNSNYFDSVIKNLIQNKLGKAINRTVTVDFVDFNPFFLDVTLKNFVIGNDARGPMNVPFFAAQEIYARVSWKYLLAGKVRVSQVRLKTPELHVFFYKGGGNNWPVSQSPPKKKKGGGLNLIVEHVDCDSMVIVMNHLRIPLSFSVDQLEAFAEYDFNQKNYYANTNFKNGYLKIMNYEFWKFDMKADYRVIGDRVSFERLFLLSNKSKFYMAGEMYNLKHPFFDMHFHSRIDLTQTKQMFHLSPEMSGTGTYKAVYKGTFETFRMQGSGDFKNFVFYSLPIDGATFDLDMTENWLDVTNIHAKMFDGSYGGTFSIAPLKGTSVFKTAGQWKDWDGLKLGKLIRMNDMIMPIKGSGSANLEWREGGFKDLTGPIQFKIEPYQLPALDLVVSAERTMFKKELLANKFVVPFYNETSFRFGNRQLQNVQSHLKTPYTTTDFNGTINLSGEADLNVVAHTEKIPEVDLLFHYLQAYFENRPASEKEFWEVIGSADFDGKLTETVWSPFQPRLSGSMVGKNTFYHGVWTDHLRADVDFYKKLIEVRDSDLYFGKAWGKAQAKFFLEDKEHHVASGLDLTATVHELPATVISHAFLMELPIHGAVNSTLALKGPFGALEGRADFEAFDGDMWGQKWDRGKGTVLFLADSLGLREITAYTGDGYAQASGDLVYDSDDYNVEFHARNLPLEQIEAFKQLGLQLTGVGDVDGNGGGSFDKPRLSAEARIKNLVYEGELYGDVSGKVALNLGKIDVSATGVARGIPSTVTGEINLDGKVPFHGEFDIQKFPLEILTHTYSPETTDITGLVGGKFSLSGTLNPANVSDMSGFLDVIQIDLKGLKLKEVHPAAIKLSNDVIEISDGQYTGDYTSVSLSGKIYPRDNVRLDLTLKSEIGLELLSSWDSSITAHGTTRANIAIAGTIHEPALTGILEIKDGFFRHYSFPNSLSDISALITFKNRNISLQSLSANSSGGKLTAGGTATLKGYSFSSYRFDIFADQIRVNYPVGLKSTVSGELHLQTNQEASYLVGDINMLQGLYTESFEATPDVFGTARVPTFAGLAGAVSTSGDIKLDVHIHSDENLMVKNNFANIQSSANCDLIGTFDDPVLIGRLEVRKGTITFQNHDYNVVRGSLDLRNPYRTEPYLNFVADTKIREYTITLNFNGTFERIFHQLTSDPPLPKDDIYALLGVGRTQHELQGAGATDAQTLFIGEEISRFITSPITSPFEKGFRKAFGLQKFTIDPVYIQSSQVAAARLTLQKDVSTDFTVTYSTNLFTGNQQQLILLNYQLTDQVQVTASRDELSRYGVDLLVTKTFE